jgi:hypothetical protein
MGKRLRLKAGDIFAFDVDQDRCGLGQVIEPGAVFLTTILQKAYPRDVALSEVDHSDILLTGWTMDGRIRHDFWRVIGNLPVPGNIPRPCSKVRIGSEFWVQDYRAKPIRKASRLEAEQLDLHSSMSPMSFETAFRAHHGLAEWNKAYDKITLGYRLSQAGLCEA